MKTIILIAVILFTGLSLPVQAGLKLNHLSPGNKNINGEIMVIKDLTGIWEGNIIVQEVSLPVILRFEFADDTIKGFMDSPAQNVFGLHVDKIELSKNTLNLNIPSVDGGYSGEIQNIDSIKGLWSQGGMSYPLDIQRKKEN